MQSLLPQVHQQDGSHQLLEIVTGLGSMGGNHDVLGAGQGRRGRDPGHRLCGIAGGPGNRRAAGGGPGSAAGITRLNRATKVVGTMAPPQEMGVKETRQEQAVSP